MAIRAPTQPADAIPTPASPLGALRIRAAVVAREELRPFLPDAYDPETLAILGETFQSACDDLGVTEKTPHALATVAER